jgi:hypothetical protein
MRMVSFALAAILLGLVVMLVPFFVIAKVGLKTQQPKPLFGEGKTATPFDSYLNQKKAFSDSDIRILAVSFIVALACYAGFKRSNTRREYRIVGPMPQRI